MNDFNKEIDEEMKGGNDEATSVEEEEDRDEWTDEQWYEYHEELRLMAMLGK